MGMRRKGRECALQILYQIETLTYFNKLKLENLEKIYISDVMNQFFINFKIPENMCRHVCFLTNGTLSNISKIDKIISLNSSKWKLNRMSNVDRNIIRLSVYELIFAKKLNVGIVISEALEIAKKFSGKNSATFINGILNKIACIKENALSTQMATN